MSPYECYKSLIASRLNLQLQYFISHIVRFTVSKIPLGTTDSNTQGQTKLEFIRCTLEEHGFWYF